MFPRLSAILELLRTAAAIIFIPALCAFGSALVYILWRGDWSSATEELRIQYLGWSLLAVLTLIALGVLWLQKRDIPNFSIHTPGVDFSLSEGENAKVTQTTEVTKTPSSEEGK